MKNPSESSAPASLSHSPHAPPNDTVPSGGVSSEQTLHCSVSESSLVSLHPSPRHTPTHHSPPSVQKIPKSTTKVSLPKINTSRVAKRKTIETAVNGPSGAKKLPPAVIRNSARVHKSNNSHATQATPHHHAYSHLSTKKSPRHCFYPSISCLLAFILVAFILTLILSNISWITSFIIIIRRHTNVLTSTRFDGLQQHIFQKTKLPIAIGSGLAQMNRYINGTNDLEFVSSEIFRFLINTLPHSPGNTLNEAIEPYFTIVYRPDYRRYVGFSTKGIHHSTLVHLYSWYPDVTGPSEIIFRAVESPYTEMVGSTRTPEQEAALDVFGQASLNSSRILLKTTVSRGVSGFFGPIVGAAQRGWRNSTVACVEALNCAQYLSFYHSTPFHGQSEVMYSTTAFSQQFHMDNRDDLTFMVETTTKKIIASSAYLTHPTMDVTNSSAYLMTEYPHDEIREAALMLEERWSKGEYLPDVTYEHFMGIRFLVNHRRVYDQLGLDLTIVHMTRLSPIITVPIISCITIFTFSVVLVTTVACLSCCINVTIVRNIKSLQRNMFLVRDMRLTEIRRSTPFMIPFKEFLSLRYTFYDVVLPQLSKYRAFLPHHILGDNSSSSSSSSSSGDEELSGSESDTIKSTVGWLQEPLIVTDADTMHTARSPHNDTLTVFSSMSSRFRRPNSAQSRKSCSGSETSPRGAVQGMQPPKRHHAKRKNKYSVGLRFGHITVMVLWFHNIQKLIKTSQLDEFVKQFSNYFQEVNFICRQYKAYLDNFSESIVVVTFKKPRLACECALRVSNRLTEMNNDLSQPNMAFEYSIGIATGKEWYGTIGEEDLKKRHSFGPVSRRAKYLATQPYKWWKLRLWVDEQVKNELEEHFQFRPIMPYSSKDDPKTTAYQLVKRYVLYDQEWMYRVKLKEDKAKNAEFVRAYTKFQNKAYGTACILFERLSEENPHDTVLSTFIRKCNMPHETRLSPKRLSPVVPSIDASSTSSLHADSHPLMVHNEKLSASCDSDLHLEDHSPVLSVASKTPTSARRRAEFVASDIDATLSEWEAVISGNKI